MKKTWKDFEETGSILTYLRLKYSERNKDFDTEFADEFIRSNNNGNIKDNRDSN